MTSITTAVKRFHYLDNARGLASLCVITWHFFTAFLDYKKSTFVNAVPFHIFWYGQADILFFFIHSGFILSYSYLGRQTTFTLGNYLRFLIERVFRIYPLFLFTLFLSFAIKNSFFPITQGIYTTHHLQTFWQTKDSLTGILKQAVLFIRIPDAANLRLIPQDWTLTVEIIAGALIPIMVFLLKKNKWLFWLTIVIAIKLLHFNTFIFEFAIGVFIFYHWQPISNTWMNLSTYVKSGTAIFAIFVTACFFNFPSLFNLDHIFIRPGIDRLIVLLGCSMIFSMIISSSLLQKILSQSFITKIGRICYSIYLVHMLLLICFADYFVRVLHNLFSVSNTCYLLITFIVYLITTVAISFVTYSLIEKPCNNFGKKIGMICESYLENRYGAFFKKRFEI